jgi:hypothetical protein
VHDERVTEGSEIERVYREAGDRLWWAILAYTGDRELASDAVAEEIDGYRLMALA